MESEETKAVQEVAKFGTRALDTVDSLGCFLVRVFGTVPEDVVGVIGGDWLKHIRIRNAARLGQRTEEILRERGILDKTEPMSPSIALPLLEAAQDETREELREMWAHLLANGMDPNRKGLVRQSIIAVVKQLDPLDAVLLTESYNRKMSYDASNPFGDLRKAIGATEDEWALSISNLGKLNCISGSTGHNHGLQFLNVTVTGREIVRSCS